MTFHYEFWGARLATDTAWPDLAPFASSEADGAEAQVFIRDLAPETVDQAAGFSIEGCQASFAVRGVGRFDVHDGREITVARDPAAPLAAVQLFLFGSAWGLLAYQRGWLPLHAAVVEIDGAGVAFCGPSGAGKSTLVAHCLRRGHRLVSDDLCRVEINPAGAPLVWLGLQRLKLWRATLDRLGEAAGRLQKDLPNEDKFHLPLTGPRLGGPVPLRDIYLLEWGPYAVTRRTGASALRRFVAASLYRGTELERMGGLPGYWQAGADVVRACRVFTLSQPQDWTGLDAAVRQVETGWQAH